MSRFPLRACTVAVIAASLTGCQYLGSKFTDEKIQYESTTSRAPLEIPPDLSQLPMDGIVLPFPVRLRPLRLLRLLKPSRLARTLPAPLLRTAPLRFFPQPS